MIVGTIILYKTYAFFEEKKEFNVINGQIPNHWYDANILSIKVGNEEVDTVPERGMYKVITDCGSTNASWDYNSWTLNLNNIRENSKCNLTFLENGLTQEEYDYYLGIGKAYRRNTYRGKILTDTYTLNQIYSMISDGTFSDIYVGDVIKAGGKDWLVADIDNYLHTGNTELTRHHATIIPALPLANSAMNETATTEGAYYNSAMVQGTKGSKVTYTLVDALNEVESIFGENHVIQYSNLLSGSIKKSNTITAQDSTGANITITIPVTSSGYNDWNGISSTWGWHERKIDLMSEANVFGLNIFSSSGYDIGNDNNQYALFQLNPEFINNYGNSRFNYWLKDVASSICFILAHSHGPSNTDWANASSGIRPRFLLG